MERAGVRIDSEALRVLSASMSNEMIEIDRQVQEMAGGQFNLASPKQLGEVLFERLKLGGKPKKTKTGQYATSEDILQLLKHEHPIIPLILDFRQLQKLKGTYVDALPEMVHPRTGRIHTSFNQAVAATGRLSSVNPNLQNIPIRYDRGKEIRRAFIPDPGHVLLSADYSQIELRLIAELSQDEAMLEAFRSGQDIHRSTASRVFSVPIEEVSKEQRSYAKTVNFGIIYGVSAFGLSQQTDLSRSEAAELIRNYFESYPGIKRYIDSQVELARSQGFVSTLFGRRRYLPDIHSGNQTVRAHAERNAVNAPIQGSAADLIKKAMIELQAALRSEGFKSRMVLQVHDELVFDCPMNESESLAVLVKEKMQSALKLSIPLLVDVGIGSNWLEAH
jgi:DNA polymerase-1